MKKKRFAPLLLMLLFICHFSQGLAQYDALLSQYKSALSYYNPAMVGTREEIVLTAMYHRQWIGIKGAPINIAILGDAPVTAFGKNFGVGVSVLSQKKGLYTNTEAQGQVSFGVKLFKGTLHIGMQAGLYNSIFDGTKVEIPDGEGSSPNDPAIPLTRLTGKTFDLSTGVYWKHPKGFIGIGAKHLTHPTILLEQRYHLTLPFTINFVSGYNIMSTSSLLVWQPSIFAVTDFRSHRIDMNIDAVYASKFEAGLMFRPISAAGFRLGLNLGKTHLGYSFEMPINQLQRGNWGSHELVVSYALPMPKQKKREASYKSIRLL